MNDTELDDIVRAASPMSDEELEALDLGPAERDLFADILAAGSRPDRRWRKPIVAGGAAAGALLLGATTVAALTGGGLPDWVQDWLGSTDVVGECAIDVTREDGVVVASDTAEDGSRADLWMIDNKDGFALVLVEHELFEGQLVERAASTGHCAAKRTRQPFRPPEPVWYGLSSGYQADGSGVSVATVDGRLPDDVTHALVTFNTGATMIVEGGEEGYFVGRTVLPRTEQLHVETIEVLPGGG
ncbi:MAG: hypothetical protein S0880_14410 [Actinomycetota bacterium]|nr:hypothetical protein [Actinomycetota bacterium]